MWVKKGTRSVLIVKHDSVWMSVYSAPYIKPRDFKTKDLAIAAAKKWLKK